jgi:hypothetical protein
LTIKRPGILAYSKYLDECGVSLAAEEQAPSDTSLRHSLQLVRLAEEIGETFGYRDPETARSITDEKLQFYIKYFEDRKEALRSNLSPALANDRTTLSPFLSLRPCLYT